MHVALHGGISNIPRGGQLAYTARVFKALKMAQCGAVSDELRSRRLCGHILGVYLLWHVLCGMRHNWNNTKNKHSPCARMSYRIQGTGGCAGRMSSHFGGQTMPGSFRVLGAHSIGAYPAGGHMVQHQQEEDHFEFPITRKKTAGTGHPGAFPTEGEMAQHQQGEDRLGFASTQKKQKGRTGHPVPNIPSWQPSVATGPIAFPLTVRFMAPPCNTFYNSVLHPLAPCNDCCSWPPCLAVRYLISPSETTTHTRPAALQNSPAASSTPPPQSAAAPPSARFWGGPPPASACQSVDLWGLRPRACTSGR
eukprot:963887-Pelagomonas_calceolata.AAC.2